MVPLWWRVNRSSPNALLDIGYPFLAVAHDSIKQEKTILFTIMYKDLILFTMEVHYPRSYLPLPVMDG